jgi:hypothetical protein
MSKHLSGWTKVESLLYLNLMSSSVASVQESEGEGGKEGGREGGREGGKEAAWLAGRCSRRRKWNQERGKGEMEERKKGRKGGRKEREGGEGGREGRA